MPASSKVSVAWQIVFTFLPIVNFWAFYRIRKLRKYVLYVIVPEIVVSIVILAIVNSWQYGYIGTLNWYEGDNTTPPYTPWGDAGLAFGDPMPFNVSTIGNVIGFGLQGFAIYLVIIWSRLHNRRVDVAAGQAK